MTAINNSDIRFIQHKNGFNIDDKDVIRNREKADLAEFSQIDIKNAVNNLSNNDVGKPKLRQPVVKANGKDLASNAKEAFESLLIHVENKPELLFDFSLSLEDKKTIDNIDDARHFDIRTLSNGYTGNQDNLILVLLISALTELKTRRQLANVQIKIAYDAIKSSAKNTVEAAKDGKKQAITVAMVSLAMSGVGTVGAVKSLSKQNSSLKFHDSQSIKLNANATKQQNAALNASRNAGADNEAAAAFMSQAQESRTKAEMLQVSGRLMRNKAQKVLMASNAIQQNSTAVGQIAGQSYAIEQSEKLSQSQLDLAKERAYNEVAQMDKKALNEVQELLKQVLLMCSEESRRRDQTSRNIIG
ncbi:MAG TPA: hypothetical protein ACHBX0_13670 [Arsenophonus sp.]